MEQINRSISYAEAVERMFMKTKSIYFLFGVFASAFLKSLFMAVTYPSKSDYILFHSEGKPHLFFIFLGTLLLLDALVIWLILRPKAIGFWLALASIAVSKLEEFTALQIALRNNDLIKQLFIEQREARGRLMDDNALRMTDVLFSPTGLYAGFFLMLAGSLLVLLVLWRNRDYFFKSYIWR
ncbi:hypothetical protein [Paenibacillus sp. Pae108]|uniref:hypothetical protein n=2 Tax=Paenibacillus TaxID=44249 RepID=UPI002118B8D4|nr:hypothetical protein [Paenibacillus sp. Pae108]